MKAEPPGLGVKNRWYSSCLGETVVGAHGASRHESEIGRDGDVGKAIQ